MPRIALVTNEPPPYRVPIFNKIARMPDVEFQVIFCCRREPNRHWNLPPLEFDHVFLRERITTVNGRYIHNNPDVVTDGFNPTALYAFAYSWLKGIAHVPMTDGTDVSEQALSGVHRAIRRFVYARSAAFLSASIGGDRLYGSYGIPIERCFKSCLCVNNTVFTPSVQDPEKEFDFIFCGRMEPAKSPLFALNVALDVAKKMNRKTSILFVGSGSEEESIKRAAALQPELLNVRFHGFATQQELPALYRSARIFLFPTLADVWGVVANEACAAGLPVIVSPHAGVVGELVLNGQNGFVCDLDADLWAERAILLLTDQALHRKFSERSLSLVNQYTFDNGASGLLDACHAALAAEVPRQSNAKGRI
jgi:glycosyltransferase involved in cell wall biosynthesis